MIYILILCVLFCLSYIYDYKRVERNKSLWYKVVLLIFILLAGFRYRLGIDTVSYEYTFYNDTILFSEWSYSRLFINSETDPAYLMLTSVFKSLFSSWEVVQFVISLFVNIVIFRFFSKYTQCPFIALLFYFCLLYYDLNFETLRQALSLSFFLIAIDFFVNKNLLKYYLFLMVAILFHRVAFVALLLPFLRFLRINLVSVSLLVSLFVLVEVINTYFSEIAQLFSLVGAESISEKLVGYAESEKYGGLISRSFVNFINIFVVTLFPFIYASYLDKKYNSRKLEMFEPCLIFYLLSVIISVSIPIFYRYGQFFMPFAILFLSNGFYSLLYKKRAFIPKLVFFISCLFVFYINLYRFVKVSDETGNPMLVRFYPYSSIFDQDKNEIRESEYNYYFRR